LLRISLSASLSAKDALGSCAGCYGIGPPTTGPAMIVLLLLSLVVEMPEPLALKHGQPTGTQFAIAAVIGAVWATFNLLTRKSRRVLAEMAADLTDNKAGVSAGAVGAVGGQDVPPDALNAIRLPEWQPEQANRAGRLSSKSSRVLH
jgi:hypothetical protein